MSEPLTNHNTIHNSEARWTEESNQWIGENFNIAPELIQEYKDTFTCNLLQVHKGYLAARTIAHAEHAREMQELREKYEAQLECLREFYVKKDVIVFGRDEEIENLRLIKSSQSDIINSKTHQIKKRDKLLDNILGIMKGRVHQNYDGEITITESEYDQFFKDYGELKWIRVGNEHCTI